MKYSNEIYLAQYDDSITTGTICNAEFYIYGTTQPNLNQYMFGSSYLNNPFIKYWEYQTTVFTVNSDNSIYVLFLERFNQAEEKSGLYSHIRLSTFSEAENVVDLKLDYPNSMLVLIVKNSWTKEMYLMIVNIFSLNIVDERLITGY